MSRSALMRTVSVLSVAATLGLGALPAAAQTAPSSGCSSIDFQLANPTPGSRVEIGSDIIQGVAMTTNGGSNGIDRVDFFLGSRDEGGMSLGSAVPGMTAGPFGPGSFQATVDFPSSVTGSHDLWAYAHSSVTNQEAVISVPIAIGEDTAKAFTTPPTDDTMMCLGTAPTGTGTGMTSTTTTGTGTGTGTGTTTTSTTGTGTTSTTGTTPVTSGTTIVNPPNATTTTTTITTEGVASNQTMTLEVGNPSSGDTIHAGAYNMVGRALDRAATSGSGIDRVDIFLDNRDEGGVFLGTATMLSNNMWSVTVTIPTNNLGLHNLTVYAHSSVTGAELPVTVPVTVVI